MRPQVPEGHRVTYRHRRVAKDGQYIEGSDRLFAPAAKGGETEARVFGPDDSLVAIGVATCHERDNFNRRIGRDVALGRALKRLEQKQLMARAEARQGSTWDTYDGNPPPRAS